MKNNLYYYQPAAYNIQHSIIIMYPLFYDVQKNFDTTIILPKM